MAEFHKFFTVMPCLLILIWWSLWIAVCSMMIHNDNKVVGLKADLNYIYQVQEDWNTKPFVDMVVTTDYKCPATHPDEVLYDLWLGATLLCDCIERDGTAYRDTHCDKGKNGQHSGD